MLSILSITFPIYAAIGLGYLLVRRSVFTPSGMRIFGGYVMNVALPALLFNAVASRDVGQVFDLSYVAVFLTGGLATIAVALVWFWATGATPSRRAVAVMGTTCPNSGYVGYPVMLLAFPGFAGQILALNMLVENFILIPICLAIMEMSRPGGEGHVWRKTGAILLGVLRRPMVLALIAGLVVSLTGVPIPEPMTRLFTMLAASASALALIVIGGALVGVPMKGNRAMAAQIVAGKLLLHPALTALALVAFTALGLVSLGPEMAAAVILSTAMPMFGIYALFAQEHGHEGMASIAQLAATLGAFFTLSGLLAWLL